MCVCFVFFFVFDYIVFGLVCRWRVHGSSTTLAHGGVDLMLVDIYEILFLAYPPLPILSWCGMNVQLTKWRQFLSSCNLFCTMMMH